MIKTGAGTLTLGGTNTFNGSLAVTSGSVRLNAANALASSLSVSVSSGAALDLSGNCHLITAV